MLAFHGSPLSYIDEFIQALPDLYSSSNTDGWIACVVAENKNAELQRRLLQRLEEAPESGISVMNYGSMKGSHALQVSLCELLKRTFVRSDHVTLEPGNMVVMSGCTACIDSLAFCLLDEGDGVLLPVPTYAAFDNDLKAREAPCRDLTRPSGKPKRARGHSGSDRSLAGGCWG